METRRRNRPGVEPLETKELLSGAPTSPTVHHAAEVTLAAAHRNVLLNGSVSGTLSLVPNTIPDIGGVYSLSNATGRVLPFRGVALARGTIHTPGFIARGHATGTLTLSDSSGGVTLNITGPARRGFSGIPNRFAYQIVGGAGAFAGARGVGVVDVSASPAATSSNFQVTLTFHATRS